MATVVKLPCPVHTDTKLNASLPRYKTLDLGKCFSLKDFEMSAGWVCQNMVEGSNLIRKTQDVQSSIDVYLQNSLDSTLDMLTAEGEIGFRYKFIEAHGKGSYSRNNNRKSYSLTLYQQAMRSLHTLAIDSNVLASGEAYETGTHLVQALRQDPPTALQHISEMGTHYITRVTLGARAVRAITVTFDSVRARKKMQAEVEGKINLAVFSLNLKGSFSMDEGEEKESVRVEFKAQSMGGDATKIQQRFFSDGDDLEKVLARDADDVFNDFLASVSESNAAVIRAEAEPITRAIVRLFNLSEADELTLHRRMRDARHRLDEMMKWDLELNIAKENFEAHARSIGLAPGRTRSLVAPYKNTVDAFMEFQIKPLKDILTAYLRRDAMLIVRGDDRFPGDPPTGTSSEPTAVELVSSDASLESIKLQKLSGDQMNSLRDDLLFGRLIPIDIEGGHVALWDGPVALGQRCGLPNEVRFFHQDVGHEELLKQKAHALWKFKVKGEDWDPEHDKPILDDDTFITANEQFPNSEIDFSKLPGFFQRVRYEGRKVMGPGVTYSGEWFGPERHGVGVLEYRGSPKARLDATFSHDQVASKGRITFVSGGPYREYVGGVAVDPQTLMVTMDGMGVLTLADGTPYEGDFKKDRVYIRSEDEFSQLPPRLMKDDEMQLLWLEEALEDAQASSCVDAQALSDAFAAAETWTKMHKHRRLESAVLKAGKVDTPCKCLLLGPAGAGKTALVDLICSFPGLMKNNPEVLEEDHHVAFAERSSFSKGLPSTTECHSYVAHGTDGQNFIIIDSPGIANNDVDTRKHIIDFCRAQKYLNCICFMINGRLPERMTPLVGNLRALVEALGKELLDNIFVVLTNCRGEEDATFKFESLWAILGRSLPSARVLTIDNPNAKCKVARAREKGASFKQKAIEEDLISEAVETLENAFEIMQKFQRISFV